MIVATITSGLGNQLFQYAFARQLSLKYGTSLYFDTRFYQTGYSRETNRSFKLNKFNINYRNLGKTEEYLLKATKLFPKRKFPPLFKYVNESHFHFDQQALQEKASCLVLTGYWQSEKYFIGIENIIRSELTFANKRSVEFDHYLNLIQKAKNPISVHIRRGDYVHHPVFSKTFGFIGEAYYDKAIDMMNTKYDQPYYFIFTDDQEWAKNHFSADISKVFVKNSGEDSDLDDMHLMSLCNHHIIANSSYSWWGAWLGHNPDKTVIAPQNWFKNKPDSNTKDLIPDSWIKI